MAMNYQENNSTARNVQDAQDFLQELKNRARDAHANGNIFMLNLYQDILKVASPVVVKGVARAEREELADLNRSRKELRQQSRESSPRNRGD